MVNWKSTRDAAHAVGDGWGFWLMDKSLTNPIADLHGMESVAIPEKINATTVLKITLPTEHPAVDLLLPVEDMDPEHPELTFQRLVHESQFIITEGPGGERERLFWRVKRITQRLTGVEHGDWKYSSVTVEAESIYRYTHHITCRANPSSPLWIQTPYRDFRAGQALPTLKQYLHVNLQRDFQPGAITGWDMWSASNWSNVRPNLWAAMVNPVHAPGTTVATVLDARFDAAADMFAGTLDAAGLMMTVSLWLEGDTQPAPSHVTLTRPTIWIDIVPRQFDTSTTGNVLDILRGLVRTFDKDNNSPRMGLGTTPATWSGDLPWVVWRPAHMEGTAMELTVVKSDISHVTVGGRSPEIINKLVGAGTKSLFQGLAAALAAAFPPFAPLIVAAGAFLGDLSGSALQDALFAWNEFEDSVRREAHGEYRYRDLVGSGDGWSLSAWQQGFQMLQQGSGMVSTSFTGGENLAFKWGSDFRVGDQQGMEIHGIIFATYVSECALTWSVDKGWRQSITLGDPRARESVTANHQRAIGTLKNSVDRGKSAIL